MTFFYCGDYKASGRLEDVNEWGVRKFFERDNHAYLKTLLGNRRQDSWINVVTNYRLDNRGNALQFPVEIVLFLQYPGPIWIPLNLLFSGYCGLLSRGEKRLWREANHLPQLLRRLRRSGPILQLPQCAFMSCIATTSPLRVFGPGASVRTCAVKSSVSVPLQ